MTKSRGKRVPYQFYIGQKFGMLKLLSIHYRPRTVKGQPDGRTAWGTCLCDCGTTKDIRVECIVKGVTSSCGCAWKKLAWATRREKGNLCAKGHDLSVAGIKNGWCAVCDKERNKTKSKEREARFKAAGTTYRKWLKIHNPEQLRKTQERVRVKYLAKKYGLTTGALDAMVALQGGRCAICGTDKPGGRTGRLHIDHCHKTGAVRALLCAACNLTLGRFGDDPELLEKAAAYLRFHRERATAAAA